MTHYPVEELENYEDDGTMPNNVAKLSEAVVGHKIVNVEWNVELTNVDRYWGAGYGTVITLDNGKKVELADTDDCCASTELESLLLHPDKVDHVITGVGTTDKYNTWHIYADAGDVLELSVSWSPGNPFYYGYGFNINVIDNEE